MSTAPAKTDSTAVEETHPGTDLVGTDGDRGVYRGGPSAWTPAERDELRALAGIDEASDGDLAMLKSVVDRTGLDPFIKQIYLVGRKTKTGGYRGEPERWETKWTVQVGIDGFRAVTNRYAEQRGLDVEIGKPVFYGEDGQPRPFWLKRNGYPAAAEVTIRVGQTTATAVAVWDEYVQTKRNGDPNSMWDKMPTVMLAKCAEAQAHRRVCSLNAGIYEPAEMAHMDSEPVRVQSQRADRPGKGRAAARAALGIGNQPPTSDSGDQHANAAEQPADAETTTAEETHPATQEQIDTLIRELDAANVTEAERPNYVRGVVGREVNGWPDLTAREVADVIEFTTTGELPIRG
ncbi:recombinase RecT [Tomitella fengzijianii]|uniref:Phage recombination protein Bet n=1 Tax=Tomitella fengzijianii TaxID=2597660 RepID=A0A516X4G4_9ACTN|nr:recombinase RecT [Tomitella fengzijianii]QDQ97957.1 hypothetical protein FO059_12335 [Tomitella fengzijianii]